MRNRLRRSELELRGPRHGLESGCSNSPGERSERLFALIPNLATKGGDLQVPRGSEGFRGVPRGSEGFRG
eukprot:6120853-Alexandrium_andersonii.AAC.1